MKLSQISTFRFVFSLGFLALTPLSGALAHHLDDSVCSQCSFSQPDRPEMKYHEAQGFGFGFEASVSLEATYDRAGYYIEQDESYAYLPHDNSNYDDLVKQAKRREHAAMDYNYAQNFGGYGPARGYLKRKGIGGGYNYAYGELLRTKRHAQRKHRHVNNAWAQTYDPGLFVQYGNENGGY